MEWTAAQRQVLEHGDGWLQASGPAGSGKSTVLVARWRQAGPAHGGRVLVLCRSRAAADRFRRAALGDQWWAGEDLPVTTWYGAAFDLVRRHRGDRRLLGRAEQWSVVRRLLADDGPAGWPSCAQFLDRAAFVDEVAAAVVAVQESGASDPSVLAVANLCGVGERWADLVAFTERYRQATAAMGALDGAQLLAEAAAILADPAVAAAESSRWDEALIDDADTMTPLMGRLVQGLAPPRVVAAGDTGGIAASGRPKAGRWFERFPWPETVYLAERHRALVTAALVRCRHPSTEADVVAGVLLAARADGVPWREMAVLLRSRRDRAPGIRRALVRHGIPVRSVPGSVATEPAVRTLIDFFAWAAGDRTAWDRLLSSLAVDLGPAELRRLRRRGVITGALPDDPRVAPLIALRDRLAPTLATADPADLAFEAWVGLLGGLVADPGSDDTDVMATRAVDAVTAFVAGVSERAAHDPQWRITDELALVDGPDFDPDPWLPGAADPEDELVTVTTIAASTGRAWDTVVVAGCLEGELPRVSDGERFFDPAVAETAGTVPPAPFGLPPLAQRRQASLVEERRLFALATSRARRRLVVTAAPAPGQLVSRFVADAPIEAVRLPRPQVAQGTGDLSAAPETQSTTPIALDGRLRLSASRLMTYDDCPLRYFYQYSLGVRGPGGVAASVGTVVHAALADFLDPDGVGDRSWAALEAGAQSLWLAGWSENIAPYQPLRDQARRDIFSMLEAWWQTESAQADSTGSWPDVVAVEYPFDITVGGHRVRGSIDRVDRVAGGLAIVDYKTGQRAPRPEEVAEDLQLATYHLAASRDPGLASVGPPVSLQLCFLRSGAQPSQIITADHAARTEARIIETANRILNEDFGPSVDADCDYCEFWRLCPLQLPGRQVVAE